MSIFQQLKVPLAEPNRLKNHLYLANVTMPFSRFAALNRDVQ
jgi:hypothetical protein